MHSEAIPNRGPCARKTKSEKLRDSTNNRRRCGTSVRSGSTCCGSSINARRKAALPETVAARYCSPSSMDVNDRVMTVLRSSASRSFKVTLHAASSGWPPAQVMAMVRRLRSFSNICAARTASEVRPEREITTGIYSRPACRVSAGYSSKSDAGTARAGKLR